MTNALSRTLPGPNALAAAAADLFALTAVHSIAIRGRFSVLFAGGSTPKAAYEKLAGPPFVSKVDWRQAQIFFGDERCVPPEHPDSNFRSAQEALFDRIEIPESRIHRIHGEAKDLELEAMRYEDEIRAYVDCGPVSVPCFDLVLLGVGTDGHTASLFPGNAALGEKLRLVVPVDGGEKGPRLTVTLPLLCAARRVVVLASGAGKREIVARALAEKPAKGDEALPIRRVQTSEPVLWLLDEEASGRNA